MTNGRAIETQILKRLRAIPHANSGAMAKKHDGSDGRHLYEIKATEKKSYTFDFNYWNSVQSQAIKRHLEPVMIIDSDLNGNRQQLAIVDLSYFEDLINDKTSGEN